jgi:hypothetical protein
VDVGPPEATPTGAVSSQSSRDKRRKRSAGASSIRGEGRAISADDDDRQAELEDAVDPDELAVEDDVLMWDEGADDE